VVGMHLDGTGKARVCRHGEEKARVMAMGRRCSQFFVGDDS